MKAPGPASAHRGRCTHTFELRAEVQAPPARLISCSLCFVERWGDRPKMGCFECINHCHSFCHVPFDVKQTLGECRPRCEERLTCWLRNSILRGFANCGAHICLLTFFCRKTLKKTKKEHHISCYTKWLLSYSTDLYSFFSSPAKESGFSDKWL